MADAPASSAASAAGPVRMPLAIHGSPARPAARDSCAHDHAGLAAVTPARNIWFALGVLSSVALPAHPLRSGWNRASRLRVRTPICGQSTVTHSASYPAALTRSATEANDS